MSHPETEPVAESAPRPPRHVPLAISAGVALVLGLGGVLFLHARGTVNQVALAATPKPVTVTKAEPATWRAERRYLGTVAPWLAANVGPQFVSAYVDTVLVRPGAVVKRGQVVATLDCRNAAAVNETVTMQARALEASQTALAREAARMSTLLQGGFASPDEVEMKRAESEAKGAQLMGLRAQALGTALQVSDCVLRSPFDGEVANREVDPGAFARPGSPIATVIDRGTVRLTADVPEREFDDVAPGTKVSIHLLSTGKDLVGVISRRAPAADLGTRTVQVEVDLTNDDHTIPVGTTAELLLVAGAPAPASRIPLAAATVRGDQATLMVVDHGVARERKVAVLGEADGMLYVGTELAPGTPVVLDGRKGLGDGDMVSASEPEKGKPT